MLKSILFFVIAIIFAACNTAQKDTNFFAINGIDSEHYTSYGGEIEASKMIDLTSIKKTYESIPKNDTIIISFKSKVNDVCKAKGCWMKVAIDENQEAMVKFKDYGFFVPKDIEKDTVIVQGKAYIKETSVDELQHYAGDAGKSEEEISKITKPKKTYAFIADAVLIKK